jgi:hypothetical protein
MRDNSGVEHSETSNQRRTRITLGAAVAALVAVPVVIGLLIGNAGSTTPVAKSAARFTPAKPPPTRRAAAGQSLPPGKGSLEAVVSRGTKLLAGRGR